MRAYIIIDLGFGDAGKGLLTDYLARENNADLVVRYNGGAQAAHNVVTPDGRHHTFAQFGSATFISGVRTYLSRYVVIHPTALLVEGTLLQGKGITDAFQRLRISDQAFVITPFHQAANRIREILRADARHGSCGVGVGETVADVILHGQEPVRAADLTQPNILRQKLQLIRQAKKTEMTALLGDVSHDTRLAREFSIFEHEDVIETWIASISPIHEMGLVAPDSLLSDWFQKTDTAIFEGAQGVLLDADHGFHPYTTWSNCTVDNALSLLNEHAPDAEVCKVGVLRAYAVRHGPGPLPTESTLLLPLIQEHNQQDDWQGSVRYGWFDAVLARYALKLVGGVENLAITHMDLLPKLNQWRGCNGYQQWEGMHQTHIDLDIKGRVLQNFLPQNHMSLEQRGAFTDVLMQVYPMMQSCSPSEREVLTSIGELLNRPVNLVSYGPTANDVYTSPTGK
ncbi:MAG: adenylosuccinate synthetase [Anaerolineaceae bacterium]|nr:adenylosuccinate synthetase [Anaerolineaceae bacterium]